MHRKGLRVSGRPPAEPATDQLPFVHYLPTRLPLILASTVFHWLIPQGIFLVMVEAYDSIYDQTRDPLSDIMTCGYSPLAITISISLGICMLLYLVGVSFIRFASAMPVASSCSFAIAAACHPVYGPNLADDGRKSESAEGMELLAVKWGAVKTDGSIGHCTFSAEKVEMPSVGQVCQ